MMSGGNGPPPEAQEAPMQESTESLQAAAEHYAREVRELRGERRKAARRQLALVERELRARGAL